MPVVTEGITELRRLGIALRTLGDDGKEVRKAVRATMMTEVSALKAKAKSAAISIPSAGGKPYVRTGEDPPPGLRETLARSVTHKLVFSARTDVCEVRAVPNRMGNGRYNMGAYLEGKGRGRHPLFGNKSKWYRLEPKPWFYPALDPLLPAAGAQLQAAVLLALETIERM